MIKSLQKIKHYFYWLSKGEYKPQEFWNKWGKTFIDDPIQSNLYPQHKWLIKVIGKEKPKTLLEVGCGFGRNIKYIVENYSHPLEITGTDISKPMLTTAKNYLKKVPRSRFLLRKANVLDLPFKNRSFDMVLCHGVLMHVKPKEIKKAIKELLRVSKKSLIVVEQNDAVKPLRQKNYQKINYYTYSYPYKYLFRSLGGKIEEYRRNKELDWFLVKV